MNFGELAGGFHLVLSRYMSVFEEELVRLHDDLRNHPGKYARPLAGLAALLSPWLMIF